MTLVCAEIDIEAPIDQVFAIAMDPRRTLEWVTIARDVKDVVGDPYHVGFTMKQQLHLRGVNFWVTWKLVEVDPPYHARFDGRGPVRSKAFIDNRLSERDGVTHYEYRNEFKAPFGALGSTAERVLAGGVSQREANASLQNLKRLVESAAVRA
jgi:uncharacterized protein YndB with AHSA1/START domain